MAGRRAAAVKLREGRPACGELRGKRAVSEPLLLSESLIPLEKKAEENKIHG